MARRHRKPPLDSDRRSTRAPAAAAATGPASCVDSPAPGAPLAHVPRASSALSWQAFAAAVALVVLTFVAYSDVRHLQFVPLDDQAYVYENPHVTAGLTIDGLRWALTTGDQANWHPLTWLSHMLDVQLFGVNAGYHHLTSLAIHTLNTLLLFFLLARTTGAVGRSACVAALFAVHPLHVESVAWIAERKDVLSTFFWLLTTGAYVWYARTPGRWRYTAVVSGLALGLMSKPMLVTLPFVLLLLDVWPLGRVSFAGVQLDGKRSDTRTARAQTALALIREKIPLFVLAACSSVITLLVQSRGGAVRPIDILPIGVRVANALTSYVLYLVKAVWPSRLAVFYPYDKSIHLWQWCGALAVLAAITWLVIRARRRQPYLLVGWLWYLGTLVPVIGLVQVGSQSMADRYTYVPLIGVLVMGVWGASDVVARWTGRRVALPAAAVAIVIACTVATQAQVTHWQDAWALWTHALAVTRDNEAAHIAVGAMQGMQGRNEDAVAHFKEALRIAPDSASAHRALGLALINLGRFDEAVEHLSMAVRYRPTFADAQSDLGVALAELGRPGEAIPRYLEALRLDPNRPATHRSLGLALMTFGRAEEAIAHYQDALRLQPDSARTHNDLGFALMAVGRNDEAKDHFVRALRLDPDLAEAHDNLGFALAAEGRGAEAMPHLVEAVRLKPDFEMARLHLGMALGAAGRLDEAAREFREALRINPNNADAKRLLEKTAAPPSSGGRPRVSR
jgi:Flp pilus assembly protein TadD